MGQVREAFGFVAGAWRIRPRTKKVLSALSVILALSGAGMLSYPFATDIYSNLRQGDLEGEFTSPEFRQQYRAGLVQPGEVLTRIRINRIGLDALIVEGTDPASLRAGAGHYRHTALPCEAGNVGIAGHRTTYGKPFNRIDELKEGDVIELITPQKRCRYEVIEGPAGQPKPHRDAAGWITHPKDGAVIGPMDGHYLTLTTCHPKGSAKKRLILRARLIDVSG